MPIKSINEKLNKEFPKFKPIKENQNIYIPETVWFIVYLGVVEVEKVVSY